MKPMNMKRRQRGATLIVGLIMLVLITLVVSAAFMMSTTNLKSVGNMQFRDEALAAANAAIEQVISSDAIFFAVAAGTAPATQSISVGDYSVTVARPVCRYATPVATASSSDANPNLHNEDSSNIAVTGVPGFLDTYWDIAATVDDGATGTRVDTHQGIKITLPEDPNPCP